MMDIENEHLLITRTKTNGDNPEEDFEIATLHRGSLTRIFLKHLVTWAHHSVERLPIRVTLSNLGALAIILAIVSPRTFTYMLLYPIFRLVFGTLYPAYASYKAVRTQNVKEYVKWMMYWIVFALFTCAETFTDVFFSFWFPFYYEIKIILVLWLLSPATKGSSILYRRFVHPALTRRETEIDEALARATEQGYKAVLQLGTRGVNYATTVLMQTAIKNLPSTLSEILASQSDPAISSSPSHNAPARSTQLSRNRNDSVDGGGPMIEEGRSKVPSGNTMQVDRTAMRILDNGDYEDTTNSEMSLNNEEEEENIAREREEIYADIRESMIVEETQFVFKEPKKKVTRRKRGRKTTVTRQKTSTKIIDEPEYSDNNECW